VIIGDSPRRPDSAYVVLRLRAAESGLPLAEVAAAVVAEQAWKSA
jgi:hypothetical protein